MDAKQLETYITLYHTTVYRVAYSYVKNSADAEDICQEAFLKLYKTSEIFESDENCRAWLMKVTVNLSKNLLKSAWITRRDELDDSIQCENAEDNQLIEKVLGLSPKYRIVIHLYYFEGYSVKEIASIIGTSVSTVTTRLARGREQLKKILLKEESE